LTTGRITGFDISRDFIEYGQAKVAEIGLSDKVDLELADGFSLHYKDNSFDAVTNYTYIGVLSDPEAGLKELIRVCRNNGVVSCVIATNSSLYAGWQGGYPFEGADELQRLAALEYVIFSHFAFNTADFRQSEKWDAYSYPRLFEVCELTDIRIYPFGHLICYNDASYSFEYRKNLALTETQEEISWLKSRYAGKEDIYSKHGFSPSDFKRLVSM